jgi:hypothetical protein
VCSKPPMTLPDWSAHSMIGQKSFTFSVSSHPCSAVDHWASRSRMMKRVICPAVGLQVSAGFGQSKQGKVPAYFRTARNIPINDIAYLVQS